MSQTAVQKQLRAPAAADRPRAVTLRSVLLGMLGVVFICGLTAYNDYVVANTFLVGNFLPIGLLLFFLTLILFVNAPLHRLAPRRALSKGELGVALAMTLVSCALPSSGLMRYLPANMVGMYYKAGSSSDHAMVLTTAQPPDWLFPTFERSTVQARANDPVVQQYLQRVPVEEDTFAAHVRAVPWAKWIRPALVWALAIALLIGAMLCLSVVFRRQWVENERLPYPLAGVYLSVVEEPSPGRMFNALFSSPWFWGAAGVVFVIHSANALNRYDSRLFPPIPLRYAFWGIFGNPPLSFTDWGFKSAGLYFSMVGIVYFLQSNVALSLWVSYVLLQVTRMIYGSYQAEFTTGMQTDQNLGAVTVFAASILYVGRHQLVLVAKQMFVRPGDAEPQGRYLPYWAAGWGLVLCGAGLVAFLVVAGATVIGAVVAIGMAAMFYLVLARVVAETGLMFVQLSAGITRPWEILAQTLSIKTSVKSFFFTRWIAATFVHDQRESLSGFMPHALRVADGAAYEQERTSHRVLPFTLCLLLALLVGYLVSGASMLYTEYTYAATADRKQSAPINPYGVDGSVIGLMDSTKDYINQGGPTENHSRWTHVGIGAGITAALSVLRLRFAAWPLHPVGYLLAFSYPMQMIWFSIAVGWLLKVLIVRFGGASMYRAVKPLFMGLIIGEVGAAAFWLVVSLMLNAMGYQYNAVNLLPT